MDASTLHRPPPREPFTALDWIAVVVAAAATFGLVMMTPVAQSFRDMYADFGTTRAELPWLTRMVTMQLAPSAMALPPAIALVLGQRAYGIGARRAGVVLSFVLALTGLMLCWVGFYMPIWQVADAIHS